MRPAAAAAADSRRRSHGPGASLGLGLGLNLNLNLSPSLLKRPACTVVAGGRSSGHLLEEGPEGGRLWRACGEERANGACQCLTQRAIYLGWLMMLFSLAAIHTKFRWSVSTMNG